MTQADQHIKIKEYDLGSDTFTIELEDGNSFSLPGYAFAAMGRAYEHFMEHCGSPEELQGLEFNAV